MRGPLSVEHHDEPVQLWVVVQLSGRGLLRDAEQQLRHDVLEQSIGQPFGDGFRDYEEGAADGVVDPVPSEPPLGEKIAVLIPIRLPLASTSAPPEFRG